MKRNLRYWSVTGMLAAATLSGCQTWVPTAGVTVPSGHYLKHPPQYFAPTPAFPLQRELTSMEQQAASAGPIGPGQPGGPAGVAPVLPGQ